MSTRREFLKLMGTAAAASIMLQDSCFGKTARKNVLFIAVDDLRPQLGCYGHTQIHSPNIDRLAASGMLFERAYCQQAICMASRASLMSGYRPDKGQIYNCKPLYSHVPGALALNTHFMHNGYETLSLGKIYHHPEDETIGFSKPAFHPEGKWVGRHYLDSESIKIAAAYDKQFPNAGRRGMGPAYEHPDVSDSDYPDGIIADRAIEELNRLKDQPFFLAVGFLRPHLPFNAPQKYWDLYKEEDIKLADNPFYPEGAPQQALNQWGELRGYHGMPANGPMPDDLAKKLIHAYYACVSYVDAQIGRVLDRLDALRLRDNTVVMLWGDHGWKLGEHAMWCKHTNFEIDTRSTLIVRNPQMKAAGQRTFALTEFVDIYPTLCDLCGLEKPSHLQGISTVVLLNDPKKNVKTAALSQYPKGDFMGDSMRTDRFRYTEWQNLKTGEVAARELYDHQGDSAENRNIANLAKHASLVKQLSKELQAFHNARPS